MTIDDELGAALEAFADRAPDPARVRSTLSGRIRAHRQRRALVTVGAVAAGTVAAGVPVALWLRRDPGTRPPVDGPSPEPPPRGGNLRRPLHLHPTWLPDGLIEMAREVRAGADPIEVRSWVSPDAAASLLGGQNTDGQSVVLRRTRPRPQDWPSPWPPESPPPDFHPLGGPPDTAVGGRPARSYGPNGLTWQLDDGYVAAVDVTVHADEGTVTRRIAESVVPTTAVSCETSIRFGWLPPDADRERVSVRLVGWGALWSQSVEVEGTQGTLARVWATLVNSLSLLDDENPGTEAVTVRGRRGRVLASSEFASVRVELDDGRWLDVLLYGRPSNARDAVLRVTEEITFGPDPYLGWMGGR